MDRFPQRRAVELLGVLARSPSHSAMVPTSWPPTAQMKLEAFEPIVQTKNLQRDSFIDVLKLNSPSVYCGVGYAMLYVMGVSRVLEKKFVNEMTIERQGHGRGRGVWIPVWCGPTELESDGSPSGLPMWSPHYLAAYNQDKYSRWAMSVEFFSRVQDRLCHCCFGVVASLRSPTLGGNVVVSCPLPCQGMVGRGNLAYHAMVAIESVLKQASVQRENKRALLADNARDCKCLSVQAALGFPPQVSSPWYVVGDCTSPNGVDVGLMKDEEDDHQHLLDDPKPSVTA